MSRTAQNMVFTRNQISLTRLGSGLNPNCGPWRRITRPSGIRAKATTLGIAPTRLLTGTMSDTSEMRMSATFRSAGHENVLTLLTGGVALSAASSVPQGFVCDASDFAELVTPQRLHDMTFEVVEDLMV